MRLNKKKTVNAGAYMDDSQIIAQLSNNISISK
ncbi:hypothetical protein ECH_0723 [Ehrlichia chaffeensis str. Arkansas]|uniref:Uncharacterized protein n=1 Tax=Ehrlichia chaffeensis (strain ATCC CRL-10679 / Arkansas) TaxID=205920 RepID=Q2GGA7_EHRCR|nr:hypothetical protein ECH_0723 [Ehrlichia chaffeensis str. Arkansas]